MKELRNENETSRTAYTPPRILSSYSKEELSDLIRPHGPTPDYGGQGGCGCGD